MDSKLQNTSYDSEDAAREHAAEISKSNYGSWYIILTGGQYFIADTKNIQRYETLVACYVNGSGQEIMQRSY